MSSEAQSKNIFLFRWKVIFRSQSHQGFVFLTIPWFTKSVKSWWVSLNQTGCIFEYIFWTRTHEVTKIGQLIDDRYKPGQKLSEIFWTIWRNRINFQVLSNLVTCYDYSITNYVEIPVFQFFEKGIRDI